MGEWEGYHNPTVDIPLRYFRILFATLKWDSFGFAWYLAQRHTVNIMSGLLAVRYSKEPIKPLYFVWSTPFLAASASM